MSKHPGRQQRFRLLATLAGLTILLVLMAAVPAAGASAGYDLTWWTVDGGGATFLRGGGYTLGATAGQPHAATWSGGNYTLQGGFWVGGPGGRLYLPLTLRGA